MASSISQIDDMDQKVLVKIVILIYYFYKKPISATDHL